LTVRIKIVIKRIKILLTVRIKIIKRKKILLTVRIKIIIKRKKNVGEISNETFNFEIDESLLHDFTNDDFTSSEISGSLNEDQFDNANNSIDNNNSSSNNFNFDDGKNDGFDFNLEDFNQ